MQQTSNVTNSICCGFVVQLVLQQIEVMQFGHNQMKTLLNSCADASVHCTGKCRNTSQVKCAIVKPLCCKLNELAMHQILSKYSMIWYIVMTKVIGKFLSHPADVHCVVQTRQQCHITH